MKYVVKMDGKTYEVEVERASAFHMVTREEAAAGVIAPTAPVAAPVAAPAPAPAPVAAAPAPTPAPAPAPAAAPAASGSAQITSPMPGTILAVNKNVGDAVKAGETVFVMEAMKMENEIVAPADGTIAEICVTKGATVTTEQVLATLK